MVIHFEMTQDQKKMAQHMLSYVEGKGGSVRFDDFAQEHLYGEQFGFYSQYVDIASEDIYEVATPSVYEKSL